MKKIGAIIVAVSVSILVFLLVYDAVQIKTATTEFFSMNTFISAKVEGINAAEDIKKIESTVEELDTRLLSRTADTSLIFKLNQNGEITVDPEFAAQLALLADVSKQSGGAFDFTLGAVSDLWNFGGTPAVPEEQKIADALLHSGIEKLEISETSVKKNDSSLTVDLGASGKGIALDYVKSYLDSGRCEKAVVSVGGSVLLYGKGEFSVGIRNPFGDSSSSIATLKLKEGCISTSGTYEQSFEENGKLYHHILNPETGYPVENGLVSVTVISESGLLSDALSTACFVLGTEDGIKLAESYGAQAIFITADKTVYTCGSIENYLKLTDSDYSFAEG